MEANQAEITCFGIQIAARFLVLKIHSELDYAGAEILDRLTKSAKRNRACAEKWIDCGSACMVKEVEELCDQIQVTVFAKVNSLDHAQVHYHHSWSLQRIAPQ